jgi:hypothetical protein
MTLETNAVNNDPSEIYIVIGNINGEVSKGRPARRKLVIENVLKASKRQPDFLAFQDGVKLIDVREFKQALNETWSPTNSNYCDIVESGKRFPQVTTASGVYKNNNEALLYDAKCWERLIEKEDSLYTSCANGSRMLLRDRCRFGIFKNAFSESKMIVVSYHGRRRKKKPKEGSMEEKHDLAKRELDLLSIILCKASY